MIRFKCKHCQKAIETKFKNHGKKIRCPACVALIVVPSFGEAPETIQPRLPTPFPEMEKRISPELSAGTAGQTSETRLCTRCSSEVARDASICKWCYSALENDEILGNDEIYVSNEPQNNQRAGHKQPLETQLLTTAPLEMKDDSEKLESGCASQAIGCGGCMMIPSFILAMLIFQQTGQLAAAIGFFFGTFIAQVWVAFGLLEIIVKTSPKERRR